MNLQELSHCEDSEDELSLIIYRSAFLETVPKKEEPSQSISELLRILSNKAIRGLGILVSVLAENQVFTSSTQSII